MADATDIIDATVASTNVVEHPREVLRKLREKLAEAAQQIIDALDAIDGDPDMEPSLGSLGSSVTNSWAEIPRWSGGASDEREDEHDGREEFWEGEDNEDREPEETDAWRVNPDSINQTGNRWLAGTATPDEFIRRDDPEPDTIISCHGPFMRAGVLMIGAPLTHDNPHVSKSKMVGGNV